MSELDESTEVYDNGSEKAAIYAAQVDGFLDAANVQFGPRPDAVIIATLLSLADRALVRLLPDELLASRCQALITRLETIRGRVAVEAVNELRRALDSTHATKRGALEQALSVAYDLDLAPKIKDSLQVRRLQHVLVYTAVAAIALFGVTPMVAHDEALRGWQLPAALPTAAIGWAAAGTLAIMGAVGGSLSGLRQVRDGTTTLDTYRTSLLKLALRPLVGSVVALVAYVLLSWQVVSGLELTGPGGLVLAAVAAGFSEGFFLRMLRVPDQIGGTLAPTLADQTGDSGTRR